MCSNALSTTKDTQAKQEKHCFNSLFNNQLVVCVLFGCLLLVSIFGKFGSVRSGCKETRRKLFSDVTLSHSGLHARPDFAARDQSSFVARPHTCDPTPKPRTHADPGSAKVPLENSTEPAGRSGIGEATRREHNTPAFLRSGGRNLLSGSFVLPNEKPGTKSPPLPLSIHSVPLKSP